MGSSAGRRDKDYKAAKAEFQTGRHPCWLNSGEWCTRIGLTVDHDPAMHTVGGPAVWLALYRQGRAHHRPACAECQSRQGAAIRNHRPPWRL